MPGSGGFTGANQVFGLLLVALAIALGAGFTPTNPKDFPSRLVAPVSPARTSDGGFEH